MTDREVLIQIQTLVNNQLGLPVHVTAGSDLQAAINTATAGAVLTIDPGDYAPITISKPLSLLVSSALPGRRIAAADAPSAFVRIAASGQPAITVSAPAYVSGFRVTRSDNAPPVIAIRGDWTSADGVLAFDQCWGLALTAGNRRGIEMNGCETIITRSRIENMWCQGQDAQAAGGWTGPGPHTLSDCYLEGSGETVLFGGDDPTDAAHQPRNVTIRGCQLTKQLAWRSLPGSVKNALEFKNVVGFTVEDNIIEYAWVDGQTGFLLQLTPRNQDGTAPYSTVAYGVIQRNLFRHGAGGINLLGTDNNNPSGRLTDIVFRNNRFEDIDSAAYGGNGRLAEIVAGPNEITIDHCSFIGQNLNSFLTFGNYGDTQLTNAFVYTNNVVCEGDYGVFGDTVGVGVPALTYFAPGVQWQNVAVVQQAPRTIVYPSGTNYVPNEAAGIAQGAGASGYPVG